MKLNLRPRAGTRALRVCFLLICAGAQPALADSATSIIYGNSDSCATDSAIVAVKESTDCNILSDTQSSWSVKFNGQCRDISDTTVRKACFVIKGMDKRNDLAYGNSDSCADDKALAVINEWTDCSSLSDTQDSWSVRVNGQCEDVADTMLRKACFYIKGSKPNTDLIFGKSDSCDSQKAVASIDPWTDCNRLSDLEPAWSVRVDGQCRDIADTTIRKACFLIKGAQPGVDVIYGKSDGCADDKALVSVTERTDCNSLDDNEASWSVKVDGQCRDISDTTVRKACFFIKSSNPSTNVVYGNTDSCSDDKAIAEVNTYTDCSVLSDIQPSWSIRVDGQCRNISDTSARKACLQIKSCDTQAKIIYGNNDSCSETAAVLEVTPFTRCEELSDAAPAWSVRTDGLCRDIGDTTVRKACLLLQGGGP